MTVQGHMRANCMQAIHDADTKQFKEIYEIYLKEREELRIFQKGRISPGDTVQNEYEDEMQHAWARAMCAAKVWFTGRCVLGLMIHQ